jgi:hypothetical protein
MLISMLILILMLVLRTGTLLTTAAWVRNFVQSHTAYKRDSIVNEEVAFDLLDMCRKIGEGEVSCMCFIYVLLYCFIQRKGNHKPMFVCLYLMMWLKD